LPARCKNCHPDYKMIDRDGTPIGTLRRAAELGLAEGL
jgi:hypothetical protein